MDADDRILALVLLMGAVGVGCGVLLVRGFRRVDVAMQHRTIGRHVARGVALTFAALGLYVWLGLWFQRGVWLGVAQAVMCGSVLAHELGLLSRPRTE